MTKTEAIGHIHNGELKIASSVRRRFLHDFSLFPDCDVEILVKKRGKRSLPQNRYYFGVVVKEIQLEFERRGERFSCEEIHEGLKLKFNPTKKIDTDSGEVLLEMPGTTTTMNKEEFSIYLDKVIEWANKSLEIIIPEAGEQTELFVV